MIDESTIALIRQAGREEERAKIIAWLRRRCAYGPPCGRCTYCIIVRTLESYAGAANA